MKKVDDEKPKDEELTMTELIEMFSRVGNNLAIGRITCAEAVSTLRLLSANLEVVFRNERVHTESVHLDEIMAVKTETRDEFKHKITKLEDRIAELRDMLSIALKMFNKWLETRSADPYETLAVRNAIEDALGNEARLEEEEEDRKTE